MRPGLILALVVLVAATGFAPVPPPLSRKRDDTKALQGLWKVVRYENTGRNILAGRSLRVRIEKERWTFLIVDGKGERASASYDLTLDQKASPRAFDWDGAAATTGRFVGSYHFDSKTKTFTIVFNPAARNKPLRRPTNFTNPQPGDYLMVMRREAP